MELIKPGYARVSDILRNHKKFYDLRSDPKTAENIENARKRGNRLDLIIKQEISIPEELRFPVTFQNDDERNFYQSFLQWKCSNGETKELTVGERLYDDELKITGEPDLLYSFDSELMCVDIKCTSTSSPEWGMQLAAYMYLLNKNGIKCNGIQSLRLRRDISKKTGSPFPPNVIEYDYEKYFAHFMNFYHVYKFQEGASEDFEEYYKCL